MDQIYLSPRTILSYLKDLETKVPSIHDAAYLPKDSNKFLSNDDLNREAKSILEYVGLTQCVPSCRFDETPDKTAGYTVNNSSPYEIPITVNKRNAGSPKRCRAVLAHEICHKVIYLNGINFVSPAPASFNEIFTDLCTIYIGLGNLILDGYFNTDTQELQMGYLEGDMYRQTFDIVAKTTGKYQSTGASKNWDDIFLEEALALWTKPEEVKQTLRDAFAKNEEGISIVNRNIQALQQILDQIYTIHGEIFRRLSKDAEKTGIFSGELSKKKITLFSQIYETLFDHSEKEKFSIAQQEIYNLILFLTDEYDKIDLGSLSYDTLKCPNCGFTKHTGIEDRDSTVKCPSCGIYFRFCNSRLNITSMRRERDKVEQQRKKKARELDDKEAWLKDLESRLSDEMARSYKKGIEEGRKAKKKAYADLKASLPSWLRFLIGKRLPDEI